jgi:dihydropyrimidinase
MEESRRDFLKKTGLATVGTGALMTAGLSGRAEGAKGSALDLKVINGTLFIPGVGLVKSGVGIRAGKIAMIAPDDLLPEAKETVDAKGHFVIPGICDLHWHLGIFAPYKKEVETETRWALSGGVTTIGVYLGEPGAYMPMLADAISTINQLSSTDVMLYMSIFHDKHVAEMKACHDKFGVTAFKFFMNDSGIPGKGFYPAVDDAVIRDGLGRIAAMGPHTLGCGHCEDRDMVRGGREVFARLENSTLRDWGNSSPAGAEANASRRFVNMARETKCRGYLVHTSSRESVEALAEMFKDGRDNIYVETTPAYLGMTWDDPAGRIAKMLPPIRGNDAQEALWKAVRNGVISTICTDNVSNTLADQGTCMKTANPGFPVVGTHLPSILTEGYHKRGIPWTMIIEKATKTPAEAFGIYPRKGTIAVGSDADLVILDLNKEKVVDPTTHYSYSDYSLFQGRKLKGWPVRVIKDGKVVVVDDKVVSEPGIGKYIVASAIDKKKK